MLPSTLSLIAWLGLASPSRSEEPSRPSESRPAGATTPMPRPGGSDPAPLALAYQAAPPKQRSARRATAPAAEPAAESVAEQITRLQRAIEDDEKRLAHLKGEIDDPKGEYAQAEATFDRVDKALTVARAELKGLPPGDAAKRKEAEAKVERLIKARELTKQRFDLAIEARRTSVELAANLGQKIARDRQALARLEGRPAPDAAPTRPSDAAAPSPEPAPAAPGGPAPASGGGTKPAPAAPASPAIPGLPAPPSTTGHDGAAKAEAPAASSSPATPAGPRSRPVSKELEQAEKDAQTKVEAEKEAEAAARSITERQESLERDIALEQKMLATARKRSENATEIHAALTARFRERSLAGAPRDELDPLLAKVQDSEKKLKEASDEVQESTTRLEELHAAQASLQADRIETLRKAEAARAEVKIAEAEVRRLENPFSLHNVLAWLIEHGPKILVILLAMAVAQVLSRFFTERVIRLLAHSGARGSSVEREARARTLVGVFHNAVSVAVVVGGGMMLLQESGIPIAPLLGGAAVFGLAVAFGAQNLIRDYFYGFVILLENQYKLNDVVQIGALSGQVEKITLRMTVLRDLEGRVHFVPNGQVTAVTNSTHGWSRALFEIGVAYKENVDRVMEVLASLARDLREDPLYAPMILEDATMLGVDTLGESSVVIKFFIKTRPLQQWSVKRELLRRIKNRFDELGIEIPFPHRTLYHRAEDGMPLRFADPTPARPVILQASNGHS
ncbi:mechanosensitive ion channel family protein [Aquisphaera giovannonii]|uniref:mechanosensitive ion channel family protein n=1 Tax=Aquisphaera giovannonii TaxID=406548 RepID=UPI001FE3ABAB|nr:mechanosensitive ion channel family protein [Aquisphaera giovannonii]